MIYDITPFSVLDFPDHLSCIVWLSGCNLRCKYCYNEHIIYTNQDLGFEKFREFLNSRVRLLSGVVFSGGECTNSPNLEKYINYAKDLGYLVKVDSNGTNPEKIKKLLNIVDYFAIDFKAPKEKLKEITGYDYFDDFEKTFDILLASNVDYEMRTTWHFDLLSIDEIIQMNDYLRAKGYAKSYYLQKFLEVKNLGDLKQSEKRYDLSILPKGIEFRNF